MNEPLLSVLIPARNEIFLQATIDDILKNFRTDIEIIVGLDNYWPQPELVNHERVHVYHSDRRIGMRPMINRLASLARGKYIMKTDAHCAFDEGYDAKLIETHKSGRTVLGVRYLLDTPTWTRRERTNCDFRYLSNPEVDPKGGLRGTAWHELKDRFKGQDVAPTMTISGSGWLMERSQFEKWNGLDESHGTFGQEGAEISLKTWLSGGEVLVDRRTWYAHWNRGKAPYALSTKQRDKSVSYSCDFWLNNRWDQQTRSFEWLLEYFAPVPEWNTPEHPGIKAPRQGTLFKGYREKSPYKTTDTDMPTERLWEHRLGVAEPLKRCRIAMLYKSLEDVYRGVLDGKEPAKQEAEETQYWEYLRSHLPEREKRPLSDRGRSRLHHKFAGAIDLFKDIQKNGLLSPLEFYALDGKLTLWKGYRRLVAAHVLGIEKIPVRMHKTIDCKEIPVTFQRPEHEGFVTRVAKQQFAEHGGLSTDKYWVHGYTYIYDKVFAELKQRKFNLLELGAHHGASLNLWHDAFKRARVFGVDKDGELWKDLAGDLDRVHMFVGNQNDPAFMQRVAKAKRWKVIIDDCSHDPAVQRKTFDTLWPALEAFGYYVVEDCHYSYDKRFRKKGNFVKHLLGLVDGIYGDQSVWSVQSFYNLCVIQKGRK